MANLSVQRPLRRQWGAARFLQMLALPFLAACGAESAPVVIAVAAGGSFLPGARLAFEELGGEGAIEGLDTLIVVETTNRSTPAVENAGRLVAIPGIAAVVGHANSVASLAAAPIYQVHEVVQIAPTSTALTYSEAGSYSFRMVPPDDRQGPFRGRVRATPTWC